MIPVSTLLLNRLLRSATALGAIALVIAALLEWGLIAVDQTALT